MRRDRFTKRPASDAGPRYLFTITDARGGKLYSGVRRNGHNALEVTNLDTGEKTDLFTVPRTGDYTSQCYDLITQLQERTGRKVWAKRLT